MPKVWAQANVTVGRVYLKLQIDEVTDLSVEALDNFSIFKFNGQGAQFLIDALYNVESVNGFSTSKGSTHFEKNKTKFFDISNQTDSTGASGLRCSNQKDRIVSKGCSLLVSKDVK